MCHLDMLIIANLVKKTFFTPDISKKISHLVYKMSGICKKSRTMFFVKIHIIMYCLANEMASTIIIM